MRSEQGASVNNENVVALPHSTNYQPEQALRAALEFCRDDNLTDVMVVGYNASGELVLLSSKMSRADGLFMLRMAEDWVLGKVE